MRRVWRRVPARRLRPPRMSYEDCRMWLKGRWGGCNMCWRTTVSMSILELMLEFGTCWYQFISEKSILAAAAARWPNVHSFHIYLFPRFCSNVSSTLFLSSAITCLNALNIPTYLPIHPANLRSQSSSSISFLEYQRVQYLPNAYINTVRRWLLKDHAPPPLPLPLLATSVIRPN